jgi:ornithine cyclodeaminase/alanine dehydrogenase-like protein (mu-crystallin family)
MDADVIVTTTPSKQPILQDDWIVPGMHINAMGADTRGKQELDRGILCRAKVVADDRKQAGELGEYQHVAAAGLDGKFPLYAELGEITAGLKPGRTDSREITVFDGTGVSFQDLVTANYALGLAQARSIGQTVKL